MVVQPVVEVEVVVVVGGGGGGATGSGGGSQLPFTHTQVDTGWIVVQPPLTTEGDEGVEGEDGGGEA